MASAVRALGKDKGEGQGGRFLQLREGRPELRLARDLSLSAVPLPARELRPQPGSFLLLPVALYSPLLSVGWEGLWRGNRLPTCAGKQPPTIHSLLSILSLGISLCLGRGCFRIGSVLHPNSLMWALSPRTPRAFGGISPIGTGSLPSALVAPQQAFLQRGHDTKSPMPLPGGPHRARTSFQRTCSETRSHLQPGIAWNVLEPPRLVGLGGWGSPKLSLLSLCAQGPQAPGPAASLELSPALWGHELTSLDPRRGLRARAWMRSHGSLGAQAARLQVGPGDHWGRGRGRASEPCHHPSSQPQVGGGTGRGGGQASAR